MSTVISLRKFSRTAPGLAEPVLVTHGDRILGEFVPAPRPAQDAESRAVAPARTGAPRSMRWHSTSRFSRWKYSMRSRNSSLIASIARSVVARGVT